jgi:hypothetical protein
MTASLPCFVIRTLPTLFVLWRGQENHIGGNGREETVGSVLDSHLTRIGRSGLNMRPIRRTSHPTNGLHYFVL